MYYEKILNQNAFIPWLGMMNYLPVKHYAVKIFIRLILFYLYGLIFVYR